MYFSMFLKTLFTFFSEKSLRRFLTHELARNASYNNKSAETHIFVVKNLIYGFVKDA